jgi:hypothetical protein
MQRETQRMAGCSNVTCEISKSNEGEGKAQLLLVLAAGQPQLLGEGSSKRQQPGSALLNALGNSVQHTIKRPRFLREFTSCHHYRSSCFYNFSNVGVLFCKPEVIALSVSVLCSMPAFHIAV